MHTAVFMAERNYMPPIFKLEYFFLAKSILLLFFVKLSKLLKIVIKFLGMLNVLHKKRKFLPKVYFGSG